MRGLASRETHSLLRRRLDGAHSRAWHPACRDAESGLNQTRDHHAGVSAVELMVVAAVIAIIAAPGVLIFAKFLQEQEIDGAARQVGTLLNEARQIAIASNTSYRVDFDTASHRLRFVKPPTCTTGCTPWVGAGTDGQGYQRLENRARITNVTANPVFNPLGTASTAATITVKPAQGTACRQVVVSPSGRIRKTTPASCP